MKRLVKHLLIALGVFIVLGALAVWIISRGALPLQDGAQLADGAVIVVVDKSTGPVEAAAYLFRLRYGGFGLIDATMDPEARAIRAALAGLGKTSDDVHAILFTHGHGDHTLGAQAFPHADLYALKPDPDIAADSSWGRLQRMLSGPRKPRRTGLSIKRRLSDGEQLDLHGTTVEVFALPGHTRDSAVFLVHGVLFLGDSAAAHSRGGITSAPPIFSVDRERNQQELKVLAHRLKGRSDKIRHMAFGHQCPLEGLDPLLEWASGRD